VNFPAEVLSGEQGSVEILCLMPVKTAILSGLNLHVRKQLASITEDQKI
jgi:hypothetical protein